MEKFCTAGQATDDSIAHARYTLDNSGYRHSEYVILIAFPLQQWLRERASMLRLHYVACLVINCDE